jgi:hypothetical protein
VRSYREVQWFPAWAYIVCAVAAISMGVPLLLVDAMPTVPKALLAGSILLFLLFATALRMETRVEDGVLSVRFGWPALPFYRRAFPVAEVAEVRSVTYRPLLNFGGWGIRWGRFDGTSCRALNASGNRGVFLRADGVNWIIGSREELRLEEALRRESNRE